VGRTLALANVAYALATEGSKARVVMLDFDLEAPGLDTLTPFAGGKDPAKGGILEYIAEYLGDPEPNPAALPSLFPYVRQIEAIPNLMMIPAGKKDERYQQNLACLDWQSFYKVKEGYRFFEQFKRKIEDELHPDYLLVDSRTGLADVAGITTHQLADLVVLVFNLNRQNLDGIKGCYRSIVSAPKPRRIKVMLVASPVPQGQLLDAGLIESRLEDASASMPDVVGYSRTGKEPIIQIPYHPLLALRDEVFVKQYPTYEISGIYRRIVETIRRNNPSEIKFLLEKAYRYWDENRVEEAEEEFRSIVRLHPKNAEGLYLYGSFLMKREKYKDAVSHLEEACRLEENDIRYLSALGMALARENRVEAALDKLKKAESLGAGEESVLYTISRLYGKMGDSIKAMEYWGKIRQVNPPPIRLDRIKSIQEFSRTISEFRAASLNIPEDFDRLRFVEQLEKSVAFNYTTKAGILQSALSQDLSFQQIKELDDLLASQEERLKGVLGDHLQTVRDKVRQGDLNHFLDEDDLGRLVKNEKPLTANAFRLCLAISRMNVDRYQEAIDIVEDAMGTGMAEAAQRPFYCIWADALSALANQSDEADTRAGFLVKAVSKYTEACRLQPDDHEGLSNWGRALSDLALLRDGSEREELLGQATQKYERALDIKPDDHVTLYGWGNAVSNLAVGREGPEREHLLRQAIQKYEQALNIKPSCYEALFNWGIALSYLALLRDGPEREELLRQAIQKYERALDIKPDDHEALNNWGAALSGLALLREGPERDELLGQAIQKCEQALDIKLDDYKALTNWGNALSVLAVGRKPPEEEELIRQAIQKYEQALDIKPVCHEALSNWGRALSDLAFLRGGSEQEELLGQAIQKYEQALDLKPHDHEVLNNWGATLSDLALLRDGPEREELLGQAIEKYERALDIKPDDHNALDNWGSALIHLSYLHEGTQRKETLLAALDKARRAEELKPGKGAYNIACCQTLLGKKRLALAALKKAIEFDPRRKTLAAKDEDFRSLWDDKTFKALVHT
jgi:tetratricopeptide (TPR) repeat protein/cellulose biosynthesis protein BcsQ